MGKLIRLELFNFKSYKGHHILLFGDSFFTSIIGPNGSGKSNSMDAISFVLGIKSSHLRSTHLRDLIYRGRILKTSKINADGTATEHGTDGATNGVLNGHANGDAGSGDEASQAASQRGDPQSAWVMAVYEDAAGDEQRWKRTITAAGQSEYRINNKVVNAKQYNEALESEGILIKARNFLVFQGDVEAIASQSPKDLTRLVEQISGSLEHKAEYERLEEESEKAQEDQAFKLNQRRGINAEIKQFSEQKKEVDNYNDKVKERADAVITHALWKLYHFQSVIEQSGEEIQNHQNDLAKHRREVEKHEERLDSAKAEQAKVGKDMSKMERNVKAQEKQIDVKKNGLVPIDEKIQISQKNLDKYKKRISDIAKERDNQSSGIEKLKKDLATVQKAQTKWDEEFKRAAKQEGRQLNEADLQEYNRLKADVSKRSANAQIKVDNLTRQRKTDEETVNSLKAKVDEHNRLLEKLVSELQDITERRNSTKSSTKQAKTDIESKKKELSAVTSERLRTSQRHTELEEKLQEVLNKLIEAENGRRQSEKDVRAKETVTAMKRLFPGVRGRVHELCKPKQKKFETAVSTVLGRNFDSVVVDSEKTAKDCISYLRDQRAGQATFIPLDSIQVKSVNSNMKGMHKNMRLAIDTIDYDHSVERAMSYACGNAMICEDLATAKYLCYEKNVEAKAVTLDGTVIHKGGLMTGGRGPNDNKNARKWEDTEVENLRKLKDKLINDIEALPRNQKVLTDEERLTGELSSLESSLNYSQEELKALERNLDSKKKESDAVKKKLHEAKPKYDEKLSALESLRERIQENQEEVSEVEDQVFSGFCKRLKYNNIREYESQQGSFQQEGAQKKLEFTMQKSKLEHQLTFETQRLQTTQDRIKSLEDQRKRDAEVIRGLESEKEEIQEELDELETNIEEIRNKVEENKQRYNEHVEKVADHKRDVQKRQKDIEFLQKQITGLQAEVQRNAASRFTLLRKCKIEETKIPLTDDSNPLESLPIDNPQDGNAAGSNDPDAMDVDAEGDEEDTMHPSASSTNDYGIIIDFDKLDADLRDDDPATESALQAAIKSLDEEISKLSPNHRALNRLESAKDRLSTTDADFAAARRNAVTARDAFEKVRTRRAGLFNKAFNHISEEIAPIYKALTRSAQFPLGGQAYLDSMGADDDAPFLGGLKYHAMPPLKRFRDMDALSGGEKTIAALALLFAVHSFAPSPFFVLDEVDAALDNANVARVARYIKDHCGPGMQFVVISLKVQMFGESDGLVGILRDQGGNTSRAVTLDLRKYQPS